MKLRKLRVFGFKSFADRTEFDFLDGVTIVVGPNGCGKSNVVDAVKWTLGEQSAKSLRGKEMLDVIFNGSVGRRPAAFAETSLLFENSHGLLGDRKQVEVTRRLHRSGESEYLVDRQAARLKDIKELFLGTGIGVDAYSVIEQGKVDILLASNPQERRLIFEEAAGISRYKARKKECVRKLDKVQANLGRLADVTEEIDKRLRSLRLQAGKARHYVEYADRLKQLRLRWSLAEHHRLRAESLRAATALAEARSRRAEVVDQARATRAEADAVAAELAEADRLLAEVRLEESDLRGRLTGVEEGLEGGRRRAAELEAELASDRRALAEGRLRCRDLLRAADDGRGGVSTLEEQLAAAEADAETCRGEITALREEDARRAERLEAVKAEVVEWARRLAQANNESAAVGVHARSLSGNREKLVGRAEALDAELARLAAESDALTAAIGELDAFIAAKDADRQARCTESEAVAAERSRIVERHETLRRELSGLESRQTVLAELEAQLEGVDAGVREIIRRARERRTGAVAGAGAGAAAVAGQGAVQGADEDSRGRGLAAVATTATTRAGAGAAPVQAGNAVTPDAAFASVRGMVADFLQTRGEFVPMIEAALGKHLQSLVVQRSDGLMADVARAGGLPGPAHFFCIDRMPVVMDGLRLEGEPEYVGRPMDFVDVGPEVRPVVENLFARTIVVRSVRGAMKLAPKVPRGYRFVTLDGQVVGEDGSLDLGGPAGRRGLLARKQELRELGGRIAALQQRADALQAELAGVDARARELDGVQQSLRTALYEAATARADRRAKLDRVQEALARVAAEQPGLQAELEGCARDLAAVNARLDVLARAAGELENRRSAAEKEAGELDRARAEDRRREAALNERITERRVEASRLEQKKRNIEQNAEQLAAARKQAEESLSALVDRIRRHAGKLEDDHRALLAAESRRADLHRRRDAVDAVLRTRIAARAGLPERHAERHRAAEVWAKRLDGLTEGVHKLELSVAESDLRMQTLAGRVRDEFSLDLMAEYERFLDPPDPAAVALPPSTVPSESALMAADPATPLFAGDKAAEATSQAGAPDRAEPAPPADASPDGSVPATEPETVSATVASAAEPVAKPGRLVARIGCCAARREPALSAAVEGSRATLDVVPEMRLVVEPVGPADEADGQADPQPLAPTGGTDRADLAVVTADMVGGAPVPSVPDEGHAPVAWGAGADVPVCQCVALPGWGLVAVRAGKSLGRSIPAMPTAAELDAADQAARESAERRAAARAAAVAELESGDWAAVQAEMADLKGRIDRLGNVNVDSIAELAELEGRQGSLAEQVEDLNSARKKLEELIARINAESSVLFTATFAEVRKNFQELFRKLFGGGKADVFLEDENNPLECGIDIIARPPGKEPRNITLLSGGEKTMTAVAMLLAVFRSKPSPFCILDEVDAALDEANTHRFGSVLKEFTDHSQFIVISHRKPTMSVADVMYGVTMQETGVSKKVAVRFNDHGEVVCTDGTGPEATMALDG